MDYLFERKPEYDENGQIVSHTTPKIVWVIATAALFYGFRGKVTGQKGGADGMVEAIGKKLGRPGLTIAVFGIMWIVLGFVLSWKTIIITVGVWYVLDLLFMAANRGGGGKTTSW